MLGYHGRMLHVDLTRRTTRVETLSDDVLARFVGGIGLGVWLLYREAPAGVDPFAPANPLILCSSPLVGTPVTTSAKFAVVAKSPLTGLVGDSLSSSFLAVELKRTGFDAIVVTGRADRPVYLFVDGERVTFHDAAHLLGLGTDATADAVKAELGDRCVRVAAIGPAGERLVRYATISNDGRHAGRTGTGAVMGAKNLKAIALRGRRATPIAHAAELREVGLALRERSLGIATDKYRLIGTTANVLVFDRLGTLPSYNFRRATFPDAERISGESLLAQHQTRTVNCAACTIGCEHVYETRDGRGATRSRLEYESLYALGPACGVGDPNAVIRAARRCDELGLDTISAGVTIAWAMECFERGLLTPADTQGVDLRFGNPDALLAAIEAIGRRDGLGNLLAEGSRRAAATLGQGSHTWAMHVKGLELAGYEPRGLKTTALGFAVNPRGACHNRSGAYEADFSGKVDRLKGGPERGRIVAELEDTAAVLDSLILCKFVRKCLDDLYAEAASLYRLVTGYPMEAGELRRAGTRISTLKKLFNVREGWTRADDTLPPRILAEALADGVGEGTRLTAEELQAMIGDYYAARGWTDEGLVPDALLGALDLL
ncbi:MAG: aldehyde ferredoxin oxidoreductase family protein [Chloroflexi bacterium]|nr:aldehyde ferredoxin oxidoreductase family protein [Chloroflexota bacterium]